MQTKFTILKFAKRSYTLTSYNQISYFRINMNPKIKNMLESMFKRLNHKFKDPIKAWDKLIEFLAADNSVRLATKLNHNYEWLTNDSKLVSDLMNIYNSDLLKSDCHDYLGELYEDKIASNVKVQKCKHVLTSDSEVKRIAEIQIDKTDENKTIFDPAVGTGRLLMAAHKVAPNARLFGVDYDIRKLRIAYTNLAIHGIPGYLLHADANQHELDLQKDDGRHNWGYANNWHDVQDKLRSSNYDTYYNPRHNQPMYTGGSK